MDILIVLKIIKLFMVYGAETFYRNYFADDITFIENTNVTKKEVQKVINSAKCILRKDSTNEVDNLEWAKALIIEIILPPILDFEAGKCILDDEKYMRYIANCIIGNIGSMFTIAREIEENKEISKSTIEFAEETIYGSISSMFNYFDLKKAKDVS